ncbi:uncharacterized protein LOC112194672 [Rosa chinensis]|uniref:uncharacterized protein LOC112194672 n=1 Tax=Rosa chinensis TaxID=74649 RepID=UPI000D08E4AF|nr:uncharacterized protein LOC112194672 [Rosa chinensis]
MGESQVVCPWAFLGPLSDKESECIAPAPKPQKPKTFASIVAGCDETHIPINTLAAPTIRGETVYVKINEQIYQEQLRACRTNLIGRLLLRKGSPPMKTETLKLSLQSLWQPVGPWHLVPIGKGYFDIHFNSEVDMHKAWGGGTCTLESGIFRLSQWKPDFKPGEVLPQTHAQIWIRISGLSQEYWHHHHILEIAHRVGTPLQLDAATKEQRFGYYARVLVDVDLLGTLPNSITVERDNHCFPVGIEYENLPPQCNHCGLIGHERRVCQHFRPTGNPIKKTVHQRKEVRHEYRVKSKETVPVPVVQQVNEALENTRI